METEFNIPGYQIQKRLGEGGMATVYLAVQSSLGRKIAIKVMSRAEDDDTLEKRFLNEGRTLARLPHPNIVGIHDIVQNDQINYIAMEYLEGGSLTERMAEGLTVAEALSVVVQIADALHLAHEHGIIHRDLKPANIMFRGKNKPVLTDFGIARLQNLEGTPLTQAGMVIGTPTYMSPEQAQGGTVDGRSDQYSLGVLLYEMLAQKVPFDGDTPMDIAFAHVCTPPPPLPAQFAFAQPLMDRMLAKNPKDRYPDLKAFARELRTVITSSETLQQLLHISSVNSVSEQLHALGFSEDQLGGSPKRSVRVAPASASASSAPPGMVAKQLLEHSALGLQAKDEQPRPHAAGAAHHTPHHTPEKKPLSLPFLAIAIGSVVLLIVLVATLVRL